MKTPVHGWARDEHTFALLNLLFKLKIVTVFVDARPIEFTFMGTGLQLNNYRIVK